MGGEPSIGRAAGLHGVPELPLATARARGARASPRLREELVALRKALRDGSAD